MAVQSKRMRFSDSFPFIRELKNEVESFSEGLVVLPEKWLKDIFTVGSENYKRFYEEMKAISASFKGVFVPGSISLSEEGGTLNRSIAFSEGSEIGYQDKISLYRVEKETYKPGNSVNTFSSRGIKFGIPVCYDLDFPYFAKVLVGSGAVLMLNPSLIGRKFTRMWHIYVRGRSLENRIPVVSVNSSDDPFGGNSIITGMRDEGDGIILEENVASSEIFFHAEIEIEHIAKLARARFHEDPGAYSLRAEEQGYKVPDL
jgi:predicted amidohydrolase